MPMRFARIPRRLAVEPLEVMLHQTMGRIVATPQDFRPWGDREKEPAVLVGTWYDYDKEEALPFDLSEGDIVEVDLDERLDRYILGHAAERRGMSDLSAALLAGDIDRAEELLRALENA